MTHPKRFPVGRFSWAYALMLAFSGLGLDGLSQETDFSPFARFGLGTSQGVLNPALASMGGITSISSGSMAINPHQPAASAGILNPTFQGSVHLQHVQLTEGDRTAKTLVGSPGDFGLVVKRAATQKAFHLGLTPLTSGAFNVSRTIADPNLGNISEVYSGEGGLAKAYVGMSKGWRGRNWLAVTLTDSVFVNTWGLDIGGQLDHWFGDAIQQAVLDVEDVTFRDVRTDVSSRHRASGWCLGAEGYKMLNIKYSENKEFQGSWMLRYGGTWMPSRTLNTDYSRLVQSTVIVSGFVTGLDTSSFEENLLEGRLPQKWTLGGGLQYDGSSGGRVGLFIDHHRQNWSAAQNDLAHLMDGGAEWGDAQTTALGMMWTPPRKAGKPMRSTWRLGFNQSTLPTLLPDDTGELHALTETRISLGLNAPLTGSQSASQLHFGMDFGKRESTIETIHTEYNVRLHVGMTLTPSLKNLWLVPRLYD